MLARVMLDGLSRLELLLVVEVLRFLTRLLGSLWSLLVKYHGIQLVQIAVNLVCCATFLGLILLIDVGAEDNVPRHEPLGNPLSMLLNFLIVSHLVRRWSSMLRCDLLGCLSCSSFGRGCLPLVVLVLEQVVDLSTRTILQNLYARFSHHVET